MTSDMQYFCRYFLQVWWCKPVFSIEKCIHYHNASIERMRYDNERRIVFMVSIQTRQGHLSLKPLSSHYQLQVGKSWEMVFGMQWTSTQQRGCLETSAVCSLVWLDSVTDSPLQLYFHRKRRRREHKTTTPQHCFQPMSMVTILFAISQYMILNL